MSVVKTIVFIPQDIVHSLRDRLRFLSLFISTILTPLIQKLRKSQVLTVEERHHIRCS